jgi:hypothetical protein
MPVAEASQWVEATTPKVPRISGRVVKLLKKWALGGSDKATAPSPPGTPLACDCGGRAALAKVRKAG